jgi:outer membrane immunogenic protein
MPNYQEMSMTKKIVTLAAVAALVAPAAFAGGLAQPVVEPVVAAPVVLPVSGNWEGGYAGLGLGYGRVDAGRDDESGPTGSIFGGYRWDLGQTVLGVEADYSASDIDSNASNSKLDQMARLKLQAGYDLGRTLVYVNAGPAWGKGDVAGQNASDTGWFAGLGVDYQLNDQWVIGGEASFNKFDDFDKTGVDFYDKSVQLRAAYRF